MWHHMVSNRTPQLLSSSQTTRLMTSFGAYPLYFLVLVTRRVCASNSTIWCTVLRGSLA